MFESRSKFIALRSLSFEQAPTYCHIVQRIQKMRYCSLIGSRRIYAGTGRPKRSLFHLMIHWISDSQFSWRNSTLQNWIHRLFQLLEERIHVFVTEPRIVVSWASQRVLLQLLVDGKLTQCVKSQMYPELLHHMWGIVLWPMESTLRRLDVFRLIERGRLVLQWNEPLLVQCTPYSIVQKTVPCMSTSAAWITEARQTSGIN